jgi:hypothetical protein
MTRGFTFSPPEKALVDQRRRISHSLQSSNRWRSRISVFLRLLSLSALPVITAANDRGQLLAVSDVSTFNDFG